MLKDRYLEKDRCLETDKVGLQRASAERFLRQFYRVNTLISAFCIIHV